MVYRKDKHVDHIAKVFTKTLHSWRSSKRGRGTGDYRHDLGSIRGIADAIQRWREKLPKLLLGLYLS